MTLSKAGITLLLGVAITLAVPTPVHTQNCAQMLGGVLDRIATLNNDARAANLNFLRDDVAETVGRAAKRRLEAAGDPTVEALNQIQDARDKVEAWAARVDSWAGFFARLSACMKSSCNLAQWHKDEMARMRVVEAVREQLNEWIQSLGDAGISNAVDRVNKAASLVSNVFTGAQGIAHSSVTDAVQCMNGYVRDAQTTKADQVDPTPTSPAGTAPTGGGGGSMGKLLGWTAAAGAAVIGGAYLWEQSIAAQEAAGVTNPQPITGPVSNNNSASTVNAAGFNCGAANSTSSLRSCLGAVNVRAGTLLGNRQGQTIAVTTTPSSFASTFVAPAAGGTTGTVELRATLSPGLCTTQTFVNFAVVNGQPFESVAMSIPVSCP